MQTRNISRTRRSLVDPEIWLFGSGSKRGRPVCGDGTISLSLSCSLPLPLSQPLSAGVWAHDPPLGPPSESGTSNGNGSLTVRPIIWGDRTRRSELSGPPSPRNSIWSNHSMAYHVRVVRSSESRALSRFGAWRLATASRGRAWCTSAPVRGTRGAGRPRASASRRRRGGGKRGGGGKPAAAGREPAARRVSATRIRAGTRSGQD